MADAIKKVILELELNSEGAVVGINRTEKELQDLGKTTQAVSKQTSEMNKSFQNTAGSAGIAGAATAEFGRLISDLPYGIQAVTNNISQLGSMFALLVSSAGGVRKALKAMWTTMMGPAGVLIAFQAIVAAVDYFSRSTGKATEEVDKLNEAMSGLEPRIAEMNALADILEDNNASFKEQRVALEDLKKLGYDPLVESLTEFRDRYIEIITLQATKDIFAERIDSIVKQRLELQDEIERLKEEFTDDETFLEKVASMFNIPLKEAKDAIVAMKLELSPQALAQLNQDLKKETESFANIIQQIVSAVSKGQPEPRPLVERLLSRIFGLVKVRDFDPKTKEYSNLLLNSLTNALPTTDEIIEDLKIKRKVDESGKLFDKMLGMKLSAEKMSERLDTISQAFDSLNQILNAQAQREMDIEEAKTIAQNDALRERLRNEQLSAEQRDAINQQISRNEAKLIEEQNKMKEKAFKRDKAFRISMGLIDTASSALKAYSSQLIPGDPTSIIRAKIAAGIATAFGLAQVAAIASQSFVPTPSPTPSLTSQGGGSGVTQEVSPEFNVIGATGQNQLAAAIAATQQQPVKAYVVSNDVTTAQSLDRNIVTEASI